MYLFFFSPTSIVCFVFVHDTSKHSESWRKDNSAVRYCVSKPQTIKNQIKVELVGDNFTELKGEIAGPPDTPYEGITSPPPSL